MEEISDINEVNLLLKQYEGGDLQLFLYSVSLRRLLLRLTRQDDIIYILGTGCIHFNGYFDINNASLTVIQDDIPNMTRPFIKMLDNNSDFELITHEGIFILSGLPSEFGKDFRKEWVM